MIRINKNPTVQDLQYSPLLNETSCCLWRAKELVRTSPPKARLVSEVCLGFFQVWSAISALTLGDVLGREGIE